MLVSKLMILKSTPARSSSGNASPQMYWKLAGHWRNRTNVNGMRTTLERMKAVVEAG